MKNLLILFFILFSFCSLTAQNVNISGTITDLSGNPINNQAVEIKNYYGFDTIVYTNNNGDYSSSINVGNNQAVTFRIKLTDNCAGNIRWYDLYFNKNVTGYYLANKDYSICNDPSNCSINYTTSQVDNGVTYTPVTTGNAPFRYFWDSDITHPNPTNASSSFTQFGVKSISSALKPACIASKTS